MTGVVTLLVAGALSAGAAVYAMATYRRYRRFVEGALAAPADDEVEQRIAERQLELEYGLARRTVLVLGRAALFGGTGCGVWQLTGGSAYYLSAAMAFGLGMVGWMGAGEIYRRIGSVADLRSLLATLRRKRQGVDQSRGTG